MKMTHMLRTLHDGIMVGVGTVLADNPSLNARLAEGSNPRPIIIDTHLRCPMTIKLLTMPTCEKPIIFFGRGSQDTETLERKQALEALGARVFECNTTRGEDSCDHVDLRDAFRTLCASGSWFSCIISRCLHSVLMLSHAGIVKQLGISSVMVEGGSAILTSCLQEATHRHIIDLVVVTVAPTFIGGLRAVGGLLTSSTPSVATTSTFPRLKQPRYHVLEEDLVILGQLDN
ncbi:hypothetical protein, variant 1 [Phytophthora nicotianae]|uniref:Bacterial bifunctional deaminase-reductase C-terminal domain-containing protein n=1 Tax=Phytophthora nicotianae TaxID=4792 RepID=W2L3H7_PHYNI|nr:hypothetical protein, variant 1 [Phytophthora nicotianae]